MDEQLGNSLIHRCFHVCGRPVVKCMDVLQITNPFPFQLCILKLQIAVEGPYAKCPQNQSRRAWLTQLLVDNHSSLRVRSFICQYLKPRFLFNSAETKLTNQLGCKQESFFLLKFLSSFLYWSGFGPEYFYPLAVCCVLGSQCRFSSLN